MIKYYIEVTPDGATDYRPLLASSDDTEALDALGDCELREVDRDTYTQAVIDAQALMIRDRIKACHTVHLLMETHDDGYYVRVLHIIDGWMTDITAATSAACGLKLSKSGSSIVIEGRDTSAEAVIQSLFARAAQQFVCFCWH